MTISQKQLDELAEELRERTSDFITEEAWQLLFDSKLIDETDDKSIVLVYKLIEQFYNPKLTKVTFK
jgi:hypothetical protein